MATYQLQMETLSNGDTIELDEDEDLIAAERNNQWNASVLILRRIDEDE